MDSLDFTYLQTTREWITEPTGVIKLTCFVLGREIQSNFITKSLAGQLKLMIVNFCDFAVDGFESPSTAPSPQRISRSSLKGVGKMQHLCLWECLYVFKFSSNASGCQTVGIHSKVDASWPRRQYRNPPGRNSNWRESLLGSSEGHFADKNNWVNSLNIWADPQ